MQPGLHADAASALSKGQRSYQEDAVIADFARGSDVGLIVLADGMGGHAAGDVASKIVLTEVYSALVFQRGEGAGLEPHVTDLLHTAAMEANTCLKEHVAAYPDTRGMGATLVASVIINRNLYWISIGDSPLLLFRDGKLRQLNEDHSMASQIDFMVKTGLIGADEGQNHPDRNTLTSVLFGGDVAMIDCPQEPLELRAGDILIVASDGLQFLTYDQIEECLRQNQHRPSADIVEVLLHEVDSLHDPDLDNVSFSVVCFQDVSAPAVLKEQERRPEMRRVG